MVDRIPHAAILEGSGQDATIYEVPTRTNAGHQQDPGATIRGLSEWEDERGAALFRVGDTFQTSDGRVYRLKPKR